MADWARLIVPLWAMVGGFLIVLFTLAGGIYGQSGVDVIVIAGALGVATVGYYFARRAVRE